MSGRLELRGELLDGHVNYAHSTLGEVTLNITIQDVVLHDITLLNDDPTKRMKIRLIIEEDNE